MKFNHEVCVLKYNGIDIERLWSCKCFTFDCAKQTYDNLIHYFIEHENNKHITVALYTDDSLIMMKEV